MDKVSPTKAVPKPEFGWVLDPGRFKTALERYILGKSGVALEIEFATAAKKDEALKVSRVTVKYVYLQIIHANSNVFKLAVKDLFKTDKDRATWVPRLRSHLAGKGPTPAIWEATTYSLKQSVLTDTMAELSKAKLLEAKDLPSAVDHLNPKGPKSGGLGHIGLRLGVYSDKENGGPQRGNERESHHITQFLLVQHLANQAGGGAAATKAFPLLTARSNPYPGLTASGVSPLTFSGATGMVKIDEYFVKRGGKMPAILLARTTHRTAGLHVTSQADDFDEGVDSPATAVHAIFKEKLTQPYVDAQKDLTSFNLLKRTQKPEVVQAQFFNAIQQTYGWMRDFMKERLKDGLKDAELTYYNGLARDKPLPELTETHLAEVGFAALEHNKTLMTAAGFKG
jgi:hypothetical protein